MDDVKLNKLLKNSDLMDLVKQLKYTSSAEDAISIKIFANHQALKIYNSLSYIEKRELEKRV